MPDSREHRGAHPSDAQYFAPAALPVLQAATTDLSWLLSRGYTSLSALKLVGDRYALHKRQRDAVMRASCSDAAVRLRQAKLQRLQRNGELWIDGFNVLLTLEVALGGGVVLGCRDGCLRDLASVHGTYRRVHETVPAISLLGSYLQTFEPRHVHLVLDRPVSNSGRLRALVEQDWSARFPLQTHVVPDADRLLLAASSSVATADSQILDACHTWTNLAHDLITQQLPASGLIPLSI